MPKSATLLKVLAGQSWHVTADQIMDALGFKSGAGSPVGAVTPDYVGQEYYDTAAKVFYRATDVTNADWSTTLVASGNQIIALTANYAAADSAAAQKVFNSPTNGALTVLPLTTYMFEAEYTINNTGTTSHTWSTLFGGTATFTSIGYSVHSRTGVTSPATITALSSLQIAVATAVAITAASTSATETVTASLKGVMRINGGGTVIPQIQASAQPGLSGTPGVTVLANSYFRAFAIGNNTVASVGNWT